MLLRIIGINVPVHFLYVLFEFLVVFVALQLALIDLIRSSCYFVDVVHINGIACIFVCFEVSDFIVRRQQLFLVLFILLSLLLIGLLELRTGLLCRPLHKGTTDGTVSIVHDVLRLTVLEWKMGLLVFDELSFESVLAFW